MKIFTLTDYLINHCFPSNEIMKLWNDEFGFIFPISIPLLERNLLKEPTFWTDNSYLVVYESQIIAFWFGKRGVTEEHDDKCWISLFYVSEKWRKKGIGSELLRLFISKCQTYREIFVGKDIHNFFPGVPADLKSTINWLTKKGCLTHYDTNDLIRDVKRFPNYLSERQIPNKNISIEFLNQSDKDALRSHVLKNWPGRWTNEIDEYYLKSGSGKEYMVAKDLESNTIVGFCKVCSPETPINLQSYSMTWRNRFAALGGIGPLGVDRDYRNQNIAYNMIVKSVNFLIDQKCDYMIIDWTNLMDLYRKFGFEVWKSYTYISFKL